MSELLEVVLWGVAGVIVLSVVAIAAVVLWVALMSRRAYAQEGRLWQELQANGQQLRGTIVSLTRSPVGYSQRGPVGQSMVAVQLVVTYTDTAGGERQVDLRTLIDEGLLAHFSAGRPSIHLLQDRQDPSRLAVDRRQTPLEIRSARP